jgi:transcriptional antiterminator NusG
MNDEVTQYEDKSDLEDFTNGVEPNESDSDFDELDSDADSSDAVDGDGDHLWYIIQCYALHEQKVRDRILYMMENEFKDIVLRVLLPEEETVEIKNNERREKLKKMFPGYLFVQMKPDESAWYQLRRLPGVSKLVGTRNEPTPVSSEEINRILRQLGEKMKKIEVDFELNEGIKVISGPFRGYTGIISEINPDRGKLKSLISIFGRETPVELDFDQVEKYIDK